MTQLTMKSFWGAAQPKVPAEQKKNQGDEQHQEQEVEEQADATAAIDAPASKRARVASASKPPARAAPPRRASPRNQKKKPAAAAKAAPPSGDDDDDDDEQGEDDATPSPPPSAAKRRCSGAAAGGSADKQKKKDQQQQQQRQQQQQQQQRGRGKAAAAKAQTASEEEEEEEQEESDEEHAAAAPSSAATAAAAAAAATPVVGPDGLTLYERQRQEQIARNRARLAALELPAMAASLAATVAAAAPKKSDKAGGPSQRGATAAKRRAREAAGAASSPPPPRRQSSRVRGLAAEDAGPLPEDRLTLPPRGSKNIYGFVEAPAEARFDPAPVPIAAALNTGGGASDARFLRALAARLGGSSPGVGPGGGDGAGDADVAAMARLRLSDERDVAKVTPAGTTAAALHPGELACGRLLLAAADKKGVVALWDVEHGRRGGGVEGGDGAAAAAMEVDGGGGGGGGGDGAGRAAGVRAVRAGGGGGGGGEEEDDGGEGGDDDGVFQYAAHSQYVCGLRWVGHGAGAKLLSASFDGSVRLLDLSRAAGPAAKAAAASAAGAGAASADAAGASPAAAAAPCTAGFDLLQGLPSEAAGLEWSAVEAGGADGGLVFLATNDGEVTAVDARAGGGRPCLPLVAAHDKRVHSLSLEPGCGTLLASICTDGALKVFDVRMLVDGAGRAAPCEQADAGGRAGGGGSPSAPPPRGGGGGGGGGSPGKVKSPPGNKGGGAGDDDWLPAEPLGAGRHGRSSHAAYWAPDGSRRLLSISFDDTLAVWRFGGAGGGGGGDDDQKAAAADDDASASPPLVAGARVVSKKGRKAAPEGDAGAGLLRRALTLRHNNDTGRYVVPFKPFWAPRADGFFVGEMDASPHHAMALYGSARGERRALLGREGLLTAIPARGCAGELPGGGGVMVACTSSGRAHVFR